METTNSYLITVDGSVPLLHHKFAGVGGSKTQIVYDPKERTEAGLYRDSDGKIYQPSVHFEGAFIEAAKQFKWKGRKTYMDLFKAGVLVDPIEIPFENPKNPEMNYNGGEGKIDERPVVINKSRVLAWRPRWDSWGFTFKVNVLLGNQIKDDVVKQVVEYAGMYIGIGDFRPKYGRFDVTKFEKI